MLSAILVILVIIRCFNCFVAPNTSVVYLTRREINEAPALNPFIVGGENAAIENFPYIAALLITRDDGTILCGGSIIDSEWILTAAHCFYEDEKFIAISVNVRVGSIYYHSGGYVHYGTLVVLYGYEASTFLHDIALIKVTPPFDFNLPIRIFPISVPRPIKIAAGVTVQIVGFGTIAEDGPLPKQLQAANVSLIRLSDCRLAYGDIIRDSMRCAGVPLGGIDSCQGDSGGPLVFLNEVIGIVSFGKGCGRPGYPGVYTDVMIYSEWIYYVIKNY